MNRTRRNWRKPIGETWRTGRARLDLSVQEAAAALKIAPGSLRNIESEQPRATVSERLAHRAERLYTIPVAQLVRIEASNEGVPDEPPKPQKKVTKPPPKRDKTNGPRRVVKDVAA